MAIAPRKNLWSTPIDVIDKAIECLNLSEDDVVYDLGAGDGRFLFRVIETTKAKVIGIEIDENRVNTIRNYLSTLNVSEDRCEVIVGNVLDMDLSKATAFYLYLVPRGLRLVYPMIQKIKRDNIRVVTYMSPFIDVEPMEIHKITPETQPHAQWPIFVYRLNNISNGT